MYTGLNHYVYYRTWIWRCSWGYFIRITSRYLVCEN